MKNLDQIRAKYKEQYKEKIGKTRIVVGLGTCGIAAGGDKVMEAIKEQVAARGLDVEIDFTSCIGMCYREPMVEIALAGAPSILYGDIFADKVEKLLDSIVNQTPVYEWAAFQIPGDATPYEGIDIMDKSSYYEKQVRSVTSRLGRTNPESIVDYMATGGYEGIEKALGLDRLAVIEEVKKVRS